VNDNQILAIMTAIIYAANPTSERRAATEAVEIGATFGITASEDTKRVLRMVA